MSDHRKALLNLEAFVEVFELNALESGPIISDKFLWHTKPANNVFSNKINDFLCGYGGQWFRFSPFHEIISDNYSIFGPSFCY